MERSFSEIEQGRIFERAMELQKEAGSSATLSQMEATSLEAGIDPRFLREAFVEFESNPPTFEAVSSTIKKIALCGVSVAQIYVVSGWFCHFQCDVYVMFALAAILGALFSGKQIWKGLRISASIVVFFTLLTFSFFHAKTPVPDFFWIYLRNASLVQVLSYFAGAALAETSNLVRTKPFQGI